MASNTAQYNKDYSRNRRIRLKKQRICPACATRKPKRGYITCDECIALRSAPKPRQRERNKPEMVGT